MAMAAQESGAGVEAGAEGDDGRRAPHAPSDAAHDQFASSASERTVGDWVRARRPLFAFLSLVDVAFLVHLALTGFAGWRLAILAVVTVLHAPRFTAWVVEQRPAPRFFLAFALEFPGLLVTNGIHSPLLFRALGTIILTATSIRWTERVRGLVLAFVIAIAALALAPRMWWGPFIPIGMMEFWHVVFVMVHVLVQVDHWGYLSSRLDATMDEALHSKEQLAQTAMARAREVEALGMQVFHELKNPLTAVKAIVQVSLQERTDPEVTDRLKVIEAELARMQSSVDQHLAVNRAADAANVRLVPLGRIADEVLSTLAARAQLRGVSLARRGDACAEVVAPRLGQALLNLLDNAIEACDRGGRVEIAIAQRGDLVQLEVRDSGVGMAPEVLHRVGSPFFTTRAEGHGLGVLTARQIFVQHGGVLRFESAPGEGTVAIGRLPVTRARERQGGGAPQRA